MFIQDDFGEASSTSRCRSIPSSKSVSFSTSLSLSIWAPWMAANTAFCSNWLNTVYSPPPPPPKPPCEADINKRLLSTLALLACFRASQTNSCHISDPVTACSCTLLQDSPLLHTCEVNLLSLVLFCGCSFCFVCLLLWGWGGGR